jgi:hypothetical protein
LRIALLATVLGALILSVSPVTAADSTYAGWMVSRDTSAFFGYVPALADVESLQHRVNSRDRYGPARHRPLLAPRRFAG